jgi:hypothetical protein
MRNEKLFSNKEGLPNQVIVRTHALLNNLQINCPTPPSNKSNAIPQELLYTRPIFLLMQLEKQRLMKHQQRQELGST